MTRSRARPHTELDEGADSWLWTPAREHDAFGGAFVPGRWMYSYRQPPPRYRDGGLARERALDVAGEWLAVWRARALPPGTPPHGWERWTPPRDAALVAARTAWCEELIRALGGEPPPRAVTLAMFEAAPVQRIVLYGSDAEQAARQSALYADAAAVLRTHPAYSWTARVLALLAGQ